MIRGLWRIIRRDRQAMAGFCIIMFFLGMAIVGSLLPPDYYENPLQQYQGISWHHLLGTDYIGRDTLREIIAGSTPVLIVAVLASSISTFVGLAIGLSSGLVGGFIDALIMRITDIVLTIPGLPLTIVIVSFIHSTNPVVLALILSVTGWAGFARSVRSQALSIARREYLEAAKVQGLTFVNILTKQLFPNIGSYAAMSFLLGITGAIYAEVGLFLLGVAPFSGSNWGVMLNLGMANGAMLTPSSAPYMFAPMFCIVLLQVGFVLFTRALEPMFNPRLRTS